MNALAAAFDPAIVDWNLLRALGAAQACALAADAARSQADDLAGTVRILSLIHI